MIIRILFMMSKVVMMIMTKTAIIVTGGYHTMGERGRIDSIRGHLAFGAAVDNIYLNLILIWDCDNDQIDSLKGHLVISPFKRMDLLESNSETV